MMKRLAFLMTIIFGAAWATVSWAETNNTLGLAAPIETSSAASETNAAAGSTHRAVVLPDGTLYDGDMRDGKPNGQGTLMTPLGTNQQGEWHDGQAYKVSGTWVMSDGTKEVGNWNYDGSRNGGTIKWPDGRQYKGDWKLVEGSPDLPDGLGTMTWPDGRQYVGHFHEGNRDGAGKMTYPGGKTEDGTWKNDVFQGIVK